MTKIFPLLLLLAAPTTVFAEETFEAKAQGAVRIARTDDLVWAMTASCDKGDDVQQRQCRIVRDKKAKSLVGPTLWIEGDPDALEIGKWSGPKKSVPVTLSACVRCGGVDVDGRGYYVMGAGTPKWENNKLRASTLYDNARQFPDEAAAARWTKAMASAKFQLLVKVGPEPAKRRFSVSGKDGLQLEIVAWRVVNPCDGSIVLSSVPSAQTEPDKKACRSSASHVVMPPDASIDALTPSMVSDAMKPVVAAGRSCFQKFRMSGKAKIEITILGDGTVEKFEQKGDFDGSPTAKCIDDAMAKVTFPPTKKPKTKIGFPITLN